MSLSAGTRLGRYEVLSLLESGGMKEVYRAKDTFLMVKPVNTGAAADAPSVMPFQNWSQELAHIMPSK